MKLTNELHYDQDRCCYPVAEFDDYLVDIVPMIFNHRVVLTPKSCLLVWDWGWCYPSLLAAIAALTVWKPASQPEPVGWIKRAHTQEHLRPVAIRTAV